MAPSPELAERPPAIVQPAAPVPAPEPGGVAPRLRRLVIVGAVLVIGVIAATRAWPLLFPPPVSTTVQASGRIEGREVTLAPKTIQGRVVRLLADEGQTVKQGQLLAELDAAQIDAQVAAARATVAALDAQISQGSLDVAYATKNSGAAIAAADAGLASAQAQVLRAGAVLANARAAWTRATALFAAGVVAKQDLDQAEMALRTSEADVAASEKEVARAEANLALARASADTIGLKRQQVRALEESRRAAAARLAETQANLAERRIVAPGDGTIVSRAVEVGDVVSPGSPIFGMVDMTRLYVKVYVPEPQIGKLHLGDRADVVVDAFPGRTFIGRISRIYEQAEFTPKNVETADERLKLVFGVELALSNTDGVLKPGMPADCVIHWTRAPDRGGHGS